MNVGIGTLQQRIGSTRLVVDYGYTWGLQVRETAAGQFRSFGALDDPFNYSSFLLLGLAIAAFAIPRWWIALPTCLLIVLGIAESYVRTSALIVPILIALLLYRKHRGAGALALAAGILIAAGGWLVLTPQGPASSSGSPLSFLTTLNGRTATWSSVIETPDQLIGGRGAGATGTGATRAQFGAVLPPSQGGAPAPTTETTGRLLDIDSSYLAIVADIGIAGLAVLLALGARMVILATRAANAGSRAGWTAVAIGCVIALDSTTRSSLTAFPFGFVALYMLGLALAQARHESGRSGVRLPAARAAARRVARLGP